jgi:hypothetical protein
MPKIFDGLKLLVQFYANHGALKQIEDRSGIQTARLKEWLDGKFSLTENERQKLLDAQDTDEESKG